MILLKQASAIGHIFVSRFRRSDMTIPPFSFKPRGDIWRRLVVKLGILAKVTVPLSMLDFVPS